jgi:cytochrome c-type biogenesis protein CcmH
MLFWLIVAVFCILTATVLLFGAVHLGRRATQGVRGVQVALYQDQRTEIQAEVARGVLSMAEAEVLETEVARRLLAAAAPRQLGRNRLTWGGGVLALAVPVVALAVYLQVGSPALPDVPQAARLSAAERNNDLEAMVYKVERHLAAKPDDAAGWEILIPSYQSMGRHGDVAEAYRRLIAIKGPSAERYANLAEALMFAGNGLMPKEGVQAAEAARRIDPTHTKAGYYEALSLAQNGNTAEALLGFEALLASAPPDAPYRASVAREIARLKAAAPKAAAPKAAAPKAPPMSDEQLAAAQSQSSDERQQMIRGMVDGLAEKLKGEPRNLEGWLRLIRARVVLKDTNAARTALAGARVALAGNAAALAQLEVLAKDLQLQ